MTTARSRIELRYPDPPLTDGEIVLRGLSADDALALARAAADPDVLRFAYSERAPVAGEEAARLFVERDLPAMLASATAVMLGVFPAAGGPLLGATALTRLDLDARSGELGCWIAPGARGRRLGERASRLICRWGFDSVALHRIQALTHPDNARAERGLRRMGFVCEGTLRGIDPRPDGHHDCRCWSLLAGDEAARALAAPS